jgi:retinol-binding protein 3
LAHVWPGVASKPSRVAGGRMIYRIWLVTLLGIAMAWPQATIPETPAGRTFAAWLNAFNSGDKAQIEAYCKKYEPSKSAEREMSFRGMTGGFELVKVIKSEPLHLEVMVKEKRGETRAIGKMDVTEGDPAMVADFALRAIPPGASEANLNFKIDGAEKARVVDGAVKDLNEYYVFPDKAKEMEEAVRARQKKGEYDAITDGDTFAKMLTENFREVSHDKHLRVDFSPVAMPERKEGPPDAKELEQYRKQMEQMNCGFDKVEILEGNVGYVKFDMFADPEICGPTAVAAMNFLENVDAIIFDLRENGGGDPKMIAFLSTYLFSEPTHLNDLWERKDDSTHQYWTLPYVPGKRLDGKPVFVLTSKDTFSGAEEFSYNLKNLKRATLVGETTGGERIRWRGTALTSTS